MEFKMSKYIYVTDSDNTSKVVVFSTRSGAIIELSKNAYKRLVADQFDSFSFTTIKKLIDYSIIVPKEENELNSILNENKAMSSDSKILSFTIQPTANCQLGCHYCAQVHSKNVMSTEIMDLMINRIDEKINNSKVKIKRLHITWYGGEPLTGLSSIKYSSSILQALSEQHGIQYSATMVTNGLALKPSLFEHLVSDHKVKIFQITLDGTSAIHDQRRMLKNGNPSFDIIFKNICEIANSDFYRNSNALITIRCNVNKENRYDVHNLMSLLKENNIHDKIAFHIAKVENWGGNDAGALENGGLSKDEFADFEIEVILKQLHEGFKIVNPIIPERRWDVCMVTSEQSEVFDGFGNVSSCWEVPYTELAKKDGYVGGNLKQNLPLNLENLSMRKWFDEIPNNKSWCKDCTFLPICGGGCPKAWYEGTPACPSFKFNINERLLFKKLELLK